MRKVPPQTQDRQPGDESLMTPPPEFLPRYPGSGRLKGKVALITGGDSGIGRAAAVLFAREGARIGILYKDEHDDADETLDLIRKEGSDGVAVAVDLRNRDAACEAVQKIASGLGRIGVLVNNAAEQHVVPQLEDISEEQLRATFETNIFAAFYVTQAVLPDMTRGDAIVNVASVTAYRGNEHLVDYSASKGALVAFTRAMAAKMAAGGVRVNAVAPGPIWTPLIPASFPVEKVRKHGEDTPLGRCGQPNEVAPSILFLACEDSSYMTGQTLHPNGGEPVGG